MKESYQKAPVDLPQFHRNVHHLRGGICNGYYIGLYPSES